MDAYYFNSPSGRLLGIHHVPYEQKAKNIGVVLCYPFGQEYVRCHRTFLQLAIRLANEGFHTLRFDFLGCGDSEGDLDDVSIKHWISNINTAIEEIKRKCYVDRICLVGIRLGATLSVIYASENNSIDGLVLWSPIIEGIDYIKELRRNHKIALLTTFAGKKKNSNLFESLGFPIPLKLLNELESINLMKLKPVKKSKILILDKEVNSNIQQLRSHFLKVNANIKIENVLNDRFWLHTEEADYESLLPTQEINTIIDWICKEF